ncbi:hypothetical protein HWI79_176 [Cryptosporidium felis]|nr:hypothetical protein HWI79_176 [Cryptosporidium felis]
MKIPTKYLITYLFPLLALGNALHFDPVLNIIISSIGFFNPLIRIVKSFYSIDTNSSSNIQYHSIKHAENTHLQAASDNEISMLIEGKTKRKLKQKLCIFPEELNITSQTTLNNSNENELNYEKMLNFTAEEITYLDRLILNFLGCLNNETNHQTAKITQKYH